MDFWRSLFNIDSNIILLNHRLDCYSPNEYFWKADSCVLAFSMVSVPGTVRARHWDYTCLLDCEL